jgi:hypothetical protein
MDRNQMVELVSRHMRAEGEGDVDTAISVTPMMSSTMSSGIPAAAPR